MKRAITRAITIALALTACLAGGPARAAQQDDTAPFFSAVTSFQSKDRIYEAEFRNGIKVIVEEAFNIPLALIDAVVMAPAGIASAPAGALLDDLNSKILPLGGLAEQKLVEGHLVLRAVVPADSVENAIEIFSRLEFPKPGTDAIVEEALPDPPEADLQSDLDIAEVISRSLESAALKEPVDSAAHESELSSEDQASTPAIAGMVIVGSVRHEVVLNSIARHFPRESEIVPLRKDSGREGPGTGVPAGDGAGYQMFSSRLQFPVFSISFPVPGRDHPRRPEAELLREIIGGGLASILRTEEGDLSVNLQHRADIVDREAGSFLLVTAAVDPEFLDNAELHIIASLLHLGKKEIPASLLTRGKALFTARFLRIFDSLPSRADFWTSAMARGGDPERGRQVEALEKITPGSFKSLMEEWLVLDRFHICEFIPAGSNRNFSPGTFNETLDILLPQALSVVDERMEKLGYIEPEIEFSDPERTKTSVPPSLKKSSILRGPDIHIYELHNSPLVRIGVFYPGGYVEENKANRGLTSILNSSMLHFWSRDGYDPEMIGLEGQGGIIEGLVRSDYFGFQATVLASNLETFFAGLIRLIKRFPVTNEMYAGYRNSRKYAEFLGNSAVPSVTTAENLLPASPALIYRNDPEDSDSRKEASDLSKWYESRVNRYHPEIVIYGSVKGTSFMRALVPVLSDSSLEKTRKPDRRNRDVTRIEPIAFQEEKGGECTVITSGLPANSGREESLAVISRSQDGGDTEIDWVILARRGYGKIKTGSKSKEAGSECDPGKIVADLRKKKFAQREFNQAKVRAITSHYLETENPDKAVDEIILGIIAGERDDFIRQRLVDLKRVRVLEVESVMETLFGE